MKSKKAVLLLLPILSIVLTACTIQDLPLIGRFFGPKVSNAPITLNVWGLWEKPETMNRIFQKYQEQHPNVTITYEDRSQLNLTDYKETVVRRSSENPSGADIMIVHSSWMPTFYKTFSSMPTSLMTVQAYKDKFYPAAVATGVFEDKIFSVPTQYDGLVLVYNKKHFAEIDQKTAPTAWEEFRRLALQLTVRNDAGLVRAGAAMGSANNIDHFSDILGMMWAQASVQIPSGIDNKAAQDALSFYTNFVKEDKVWDATMPEAATAFAQGKVSMIFIPSWRILDILNANPAIQGDIGVAPVPQAIPDQPATWASFWSYAVPSGSANQAAAWDLINFMTQEEQQLMLFSEASKIRAFGSPYSLTSLSGQLSSNPYLKPVVDIAPLAKTAEITARSGNRRQTTALLDAVNSVLANTATPEAALKKAKEAIGQ